MYVKRQSMAKWQYNVRVIDNQHIVDSEVVVHQFDVDAWDDDAIVAAGAPLYEWEQSDAGKWVKEHAVEVPRWERFQDYYGFKHRFAVIARLTDQDQTFFRLKFQ